MKKWMFILMLCLCLPALATVSNLVLDSRVITQGDSFGYSYDSDQDTTFCLFYIETADSASGLNTSQDRFWVKLTMVDNGTNMQWFGDSGVFPDGDPAIGKFRFSPGVMSDPPVLAWIVVNDADNAPVITTFRILPMLNPFRTISGHVTPPSGQPAGFISVNAGVQNSNFRFSSFTDSNGNYSMPISEEAVLADNGRLYVSIEKQFSGYMLEPMYRMADLSLNNAAGVDFVYTAATSAVQGRLRSGAAGISGIQVRLVIESSWTTVSRVTTGATGSFFLACAPGTYRLEVDGSSQLVPDYMSPEGLTVTVPANDTLAQDLVATAADAVIYGRITKDGGAPGGSYNLWARSRTNNLGSTDAQCDVNGYFQLHVSSLENNYEVAVETECGDCVPVPAGYYFENGRWMEGVGPGDTVSFNLVRRQTGTASIAGTISLQNTPPPGGNYTVVYAVAVNPSAIDTSWNIYSHLEVGYTDTIQGNGGSYLITGLPDTTYFMIARLYCDSPYIGNTIGDGRYDTMGNFRAVAVAAGQAVTGVNFSMWTWGLPFVEKKPGTPALPVVFALGGPAPNPFTPSVSMAYAVPSRSDVHISVYDLAGRLVKVLQNRTSAPGYYSAVWDGTGVNGMRAAAGVYVCRMTAGDFSMNRRLILMK